MKGRAFIRDMVSAFPGLLAMNVALLLLTSIVDAAAIVAVAPMIDLLLHPGLQDVSRLTARLLDIVRAAGMPATLNSLLAIFLAFNVLKAALYIAVRYSILKTTYTVDRKLTVGTFEDFFNAGWYFFSSGSQGTFLNTFIRELNIATSAFGAMALFAATCLQIAVYVAIPLYISWQVTLVSLLSAVLFLLPLLALGKVNYRLGVLNTTTANTLGSILHESLSSAKVILGFGNQQKSVDDLRRAFDAHVRATVASQTLGIAVSSIFVPLGLLSVVIALGVAQRLAVPLAETAALLYALLQIVPYLGVLAAQKTSIETFFPSYEQVVTLRERAAQLKQRSGSRPFAGLDRELALDHVSFAYPGADGTLNDVSVRIRKGTMVAFVGESGVGKSTLIDVIMGFHEPTAGRVTVDGTPLQEFDINAYRRRIGYVPQDSVLFNRSIRENLLWSCETASQDDIVRACRLANADEFIQQLPETYETRVGDRGVRLSGGEVQRVALARAILRKPHLLILDEATSNLDSLSESLIQQAIESIAKETTVVVVAHRLSTIMNADYIYVLRDGRIVEEGTYNALVGKGTDFAQMVKLQTLTPVA